MSEFARWGVAVVLVVGGCSSEPTGGDAPDGVDGDTGDAVLADTVGEADGTTGDVELEVGDMAGLDHADVEADAWPTAIGGARPATVVYPAGYAGEALPAVMLLGGYDYFSADLDDWISLSGAVDSKRFILVRPDGLVDEDGSPFWNATDTCCDFYGVGVDDVGYLTGLLDELERRFAVSGVGLVGHSAGGFMAYRMACEVPGRLAGIISIAGSGFLDPMDCAVTDVPLSVLQVHGEIDDVMPFGGDDDAPGALGMLERWGETNGCRLRSWVLEGRSPAYAEEGDTSVGVYRDGCRPQDGAEDVRLWLLEGSDHYPTFTPAFTADALDWLLERARP